jgi:hypothetical protein
LRSLNPWTPFEGARCTPSVRRHSAAKRRPPSGRTSFDRIYSRSRARHAGGIHFPLPPPCQCTIVDGLKDSSALSSSRRLRHHPEDANELVTALPRSRPASLSLPREANRLLLRPHSQATAFESQGRPMPRTGNHSGSRSPSQVSDALPQTGHVARRCYPPGLSPYVSGSRPSIVSAATAQTAGGDFGGQNVETPPYPSVRGSSQFGTVSGPSHSQALPGLSWLSYSQPSHFSKVPDSGQRVGFACHQVEGSPREPS